MEANFSLRAKRLKPSVTSSFRNHVNDLIDDGKSIINLAAGEMKIAAPDTLVKSVEYALSKKTNLYLDAAGHIELRSKIANHINTRFLTSFDSEQIVVCNGAKHALFNIMLTLLNDGDEVIIFEPTWGTFKAQIELSGASPVCIDTKKNNYEISSYAAKDAITNKTKLVIINSPNNPTGKVIEKSALENILRLADENDFFVMFDLCYQSYIFDESYNGTIELIKDDNHRLILVDSFSKSFAITGWRAGYIATNEALASKVRALQSQTSSNSSSLIQHALLKADFSDMEDFTVKKRQELKENAEVGLSILKGCKALTVIKPSGGFYIFCNIKRSLLQKDYADKSISDIAIDLLSKELVSVTPGNAFSAENGFRVSICVNKNELISGLKRLVDYFNNIS